MNFHSVKENERLLAAFVLALLIHLVVFFMLLLFFVPAESALPDYAGPVVLQLEQSLTRPRPRAVIESPRRTEETAPAPRPAPKKEGTAAVTDKAVTANRTNANTETAPAPTAEPSSLLEEGSLSRLDEALKDSSRTGKSGSDTGETTASSDSTSGSGLSASRWEDNAAREPVFRVTPDIPKWVSEQGLHLKVELAVSLDADGLVTVTAVRNSSGYSDVDAAVRQAVSRWKYSRVPGARVVTGIITYFIKPR